MPEIILELAEGRTLEQKINRIFNPNVTLIGVGEISMRV